MKSPGDELAAAVDEEAAVGVAVPRDADVGLLADHFLRDVAPVFLDERVRLVVRERAVDIETELRRLAGKLVEQQRRHQARHAAAGVEHDGERLDDRRVDERHHFLDVLEDDVRAARPSLGVAAGGGSRSLTIMSRISPSPCVAAERQRARRAPS